MKKELKIVIALFISIIVIFTLSPQILATELENVNPETDNEYKIMKYDKYTQETTEVDMEEIENIIENAISTNKISTENRYATSSYDPYLLDKRYEMITSSTYNTYSANSTPTINVTLVGSMLSNRKNCRITATMPDGSMGTGSGVLVGKNLAFTAAHCVFDENYTKYENWLIEPGYKNGSLYGGATGWSVVYYSSGYNADPWIAYDFADDWAICVLEEPIGEYIGYARS